MLDPIGEEYVEVSYRNLSRPLVTPWEHRQAVARRAKAAIWSMSRRC
ncbi:MAG: hypothetical protein ACLP8S_02620 [Solirubrobacteraceae bacterium]